MKKLTGFVVLAALALSISGCGDDKKARAKATFTRICKETSARMGDEGGDFRQRLNNLLTSCSGACDMGDPASCELIAEHVGRVCKVSPDVCASLCELRSPSMQKNACPLAGK